MVAAIPWLGVLLDSLLANIDNPYLGNTSAGIARQFLASIIVKRTIGHFNNHEDIIRSWVRRSIEIFAWLEDCHIGLWFAMIVKLDRVLPTDNRTIAKLSRKQQHEYVNNRSMKWADWTHRAHFSIKQFNAIILAQNACLAHACIIGDAKLPACINSHTCSFMHEILPTLLP